MKMEKRRDDVDGERARQYRWRKGATRRGRTCMNERGGSGGSVAIQRSIDDDAAGTLACGDASAYAYANMRGEMHAYAQ